MLKKKGLFHILVILIPLIAWGNILEPAEGRKIVPSETPFIEVMFIANTGVLLSSDTKKVLIDALFKDKYPDYVSPSDEVLGKMESGSAPFDGVDLFLVTHNHTDHFSADLTTRFLEKNIGAAVVAPKDVVSQLKNRSRNWPQVEKRVFSIDLNPGQMEEKIIKGIRIKIFRTLHSGGKETPQNLMFLIEMNGKTVFHEGDSDEKLATFQDMGFEREKIDLALINFYFPFHPEGETILREILKADHVALFHLPKKLAAEAPGRLGEIKAKYRDVFLFFKEGEKKIIR